MSDLQATSKKQPTTTASVPGQQVEAASPDFDVMQARTNVAQRLAHESPEGTSSFSSNDLLYLQRTAGNQAVAKLLGRENSPQQDASSQSAPPSIQRLTVGPADDEYEREAETISNRISRSALRGNERVQRADAPGPEVGLDGGELGGETASSIRRAQSGGSSMPRSIRNTLEPQLGADLSGMKVHSGSQSVQLNRALGAKAFTVKNHIFYGAGQTPTDLKLTTHETVHSMQQGAVPRTQGDDVKRKINPTAKPTASTAISPRITPTVQRRSDKNLAIDKEQIASAKTVLAHLKAKSWGAAMAEYRKQDITYKKAGFWGTMKWVKGARGVESLNNYRLAAKALFTQQVGREDTKKPTKDTSETDTSTVVEKVVEIAEGAHGAGTSSYEWQMKHRADMLQKITHYLVRSLPIGLQTEGIISESTKDKPKEVPEPKAIVMMGGSGSGKSSILSKLQIDTSNMVVADPDAFKEAMPRYQAGKKAGDTSVAGQTHSDSVGITHSLTAQAIANRQHLLYDRTGNDVAGYRMLFKLLKEADYKVTLIMAHITPQEGLARVQRRAVETGRHIEDKEVLKMYKWIPGNFVMYARMTEVDDAKLYDNMGRDPELLWEKADGAEISEEHLEKLKLHLDYIGDDERRSYLSGIEDSKKYKEVTSRIRMAGVLKQDPDPKDLELAEQLKPKIFSMLSDTATGAAGKGKRWLAGKDKPEEQQDEATKLAVKYGLTADEMAAIFTFTANDYKYMNPVVAGNMGWLKWSLTEHVPADKEMAKTMREQQVTEEGYQEDVTDVAKKEGMMHYRFAKSGLNKLPDWKGMVFRGASFTEEEMQNYYPTGGVSTFPSLSSSSLSETRARSFARTSKKPNKDSYVFKITMTRGKDIMPFSNVQKEQEILIMAGAKFSVDSIVPGEEMSEVNMTQIR